MCQIPATCEYLTHRYMTCESWIPDPRIQITWWLKPVRIWVRVLKF